MSEHYRRILLLRVTADESDDTLAVPAGGVEFYRSGAELEATTPYEAAFSGGAAATTCVVTMGEVLPPPTEIRLVATFQA